MVATGRGRLFRRKDGKYLIYLPKDLADDSMFPFKDFTKGQRGGDASQFLRGSFQVAKGKRLVFVPLKEQKRKITETVVVSGSSIIEVSDVCRLFRRSDGKYLIYLSTDWAEDSKFPFKGDSIHIKMSFTPEGDPLLMAEQWQEPEEEE